MKGGGDKEAKRARADEEARQKRIREGTARVDQTFGQFDDDFFGERRQAFLDFATPQVDDQFKKAQEELTFALARAGMLDSSARAEKQGELSKLYDTRKREITDQAIGQETTARTAVEDARSGLIRNLQSTADANAAANEAVNRAAALSKPAPFSPLTQLFADFTSGLATQAGFERAGAVDPRFGGRYNTGLFSPNSSAVKVT